MKKTSNVIEVGFKKQVQLVRIGGIDFEVKTGKKYREQYIAALPGMQVKIEEQQEVIKKASENDDYAAIQEANRKVEVIVQEVIDLVLGQGAFVKLMEAADDDIDVVVDAFLEVASQLQKLNTKAKAQSYIDGKKK
ncbi:hypothetical protein [Enterococcus italicus]|uniref:hypothetical protein n=1 Tax=Enterococcus italicus TaxID=246144 RepID=UPI0028AF78B8|nr:hypothetical protein [Enterococcus italicus]